MDIIELKRGGEARNRRRIFAMALDRAIDEQREAKNESAARLKERLERAKEIFASFTNEHADFVSRMPHGQFFTENNYYAERQAAYERLRYKMAEQLRSAENDEQTRRPAESTVAAKRAEVGKNVPINEPRPSRPPLPSVVGHVRGDLRRKIEQKANGKHIKCNYCARYGHPMSACVQFKALSKPTRRLRVRRSGLCMNCFAPIFGKYERHRCRAKGCKCGGDHNTLLCFGTGE